MEGLSKPRNYRKTLKRKVLCIYIQSKIHKRALWALETQKDIKKGSFKYIYSSRSFQGYMYRYIRVGGRFLLYICIRGNSYYCFSSIGIFWFYIYRIRGNRNQLRQIIFQPGRVSFQCGHWYKKMYKDFGSLQRGKKINDIGGLWVSFQCVFQGQERLMILGVYELRFLRVLWVGIMVV